MKKHIEWLILMAVITLITSFMSILTIIHLSWFAGLILYFMLIPIYFSSVPKGGYVNP